ncbi:MAG: MG2 domain-containing protein, partial [Planctomycetota bacterium]
MNCRHVQDMLDDYVFDLLDDDERTELETHLEACDECRSACRQARARRHQLELWEEDPAPGDLAETTLAALDLGQHARPDRPGATDTPVDNDWPWLSSRRFWTLVGSVAAAVVLLAALYVYAVTGPPPDPQETLLVGLRWLAPGQPITCRLVVRDGRDGSPVEDFHARAVLYSDDGKMVWQWSTEAVGAGGIASIEDRLPATLSEGDYTLGVVTSSGLGRSQFFQDVVVRRGARVMLSTDKPLYQPGQVMRIRTLSLGTSDLRPLDDKPVTVGVHDAKGNKVFKKVLRTSAFGIAATEFHLADQVNLGDYTITATLDEVVSTRSVRVDRYRLPTFKVTLATDRAWYAPGDVLEGDVSAQYTFGKPVAGARVRVSASQFLETQRTFATVEGTTDSDGRFHFALNLEEYFVGTPRTHGNASVQLDATVEDRGGHEQSTTTGVSVAEDPIHVEVFPESGTLVQGVENLLYVVTAYPDGTPARTRLTIGATDRQAQTSELGIAQVHITPHDTNLQLTVTAVDDRGQRATVIQPLRVGESDQRVLLRTDRSLYRTGETMELTVLSADDNQRVFVDVIRDGRAVLARSIDVVGGRGTLSVDLPDDLFGTLEVNAYRIMDGGEITADTKVVQVYRATDLAVTATLDKDTYRPAETAILRFAVTDAEGRPTVAALGLSGLDEAVFALHQMTPGLE